MPPHRVFCVLFFITVGIAGCTSGRPITNLHDRITETREETGVPALSAIVKRDGKIYASAAVGERAQGSGVSVTVNDRWHIGSITKSMTATLVARLVEHNIISWDDSIEKILGDVIPDMHPSYRSVNFRHLLSHRAGLHRSIPIEQYRRFKQNPVDVKTDRLKWSQFALAQDPIGPKEKTSHYSNAGYVIAGTMLEVRTGKTWEQLISEEVFTPLGLKTAGFGPPGRPEVMDEPRGHWRKSGAYQPVDVTSDLPAAQGPAGLVHMSLDDLTRYADMHRRRDPSYLTEESFTILHTPPFGGEYALGWALLPDGKLAHNGSNRRWYVIVAFWPQEQMSGAVATNGGDFDRLHIPLDQVLIDLLESVRTDTLLPTQKSK